MIACQLLLEITTFLRETYQYIPRTKVSAVAGDHYIPEGDLPVHTQNQGEWCCWRSLHFLRETYQYIPRTKVSAAAGDHYIPQGGLPVHTQNQGEWYCWRSLHSWGRPTSTYPEPRWVLLLEITTFLRETYQYIPRTKVSGTSPVYTQNQGECCCWRSLHSSGRPTST